MLSEAEAFESEIALIELFGRKDIGTGCLRNMTAGGENPPRSQKGMHSPAFKAALAERSKGNKYRAGRNVSLAERQQTSRRFKGRVFSSETKQKMSESQVGYRRSEESKEKASASRLGKSYKRGWHHSAEARARMLTSRKGHPSYVTAEGIAKMRATKLAKAKRS